MSKIKAGRNSSKKEVIIEKGAELFRRKGYAATSMRELAEMIGVEAPSLYNHIESKAGILQDICFTVAEEFRLNLEAVQVEDIDAPAAMDKLLRFHIHMMLHKYNEVYVANHEWRQLEEPFLSDFLSQRKNYENRMVQIVTKGIANNDFKKTNPVVAVLLLLSAVRGLEFWQGHKKNMSMPGLEDDIVNQLLTGLIK